MMDLWTELDFLHDAEMNDIHLEIDQKGHRCVRMYLTCNEEAGHPTWDGKKLCLLAKGVFLFSCFALGYTSGIDTFDRFDANISEQSASLLRKCEISGLNTPPIKIHIVLNSGSWMDLVCKIVEVSPL